MNSIEGLIRDNLYEFYDGIAQSCGLDSEKTDYWSVLKNIPGFWPRVIYRIESGIASMPASGLFSEKVKSGIYPELVIASDENIRQIDPFLRQQGFFPFSGWKGMAITNMQNNTLPELPAAIEIVKPESLDDLEQWLKIVASELIAPDQLDSTQLQSLIAMGSAEAYLLKNNGVGVSTILVFESAGSTGLYLIATEKSAQKQGFASLLVQYILALNNRSLKKPVILHATKLGELLYLKLGFQSFNQFFLYRYLKPNS